MRDGFKQIVDGWEAHSEPAEIDGRIRRATLWLASNRPPGASSRCSRRSRTLPALASEGLVISAMIERAIILATGQIVDGYLRRAGVVSIKVEDAPRPLPELDHPDPFDCYRETFNRPGRE